MIDIWPRYRSLNSLLTDHWWTLWPWQESLLDIVILRWVINRHFYITTDHWRRSDLDMDHCSTLWHGSLLDTLSLTWIIDWHSVLDVDHWLTLNLTRIIDRHFTLTRGNDRRSDLAIFFSILMLTMLQEDIFKRPPKFECHLLNTL